MHAEASDTNPYLQQEVMTASPIRLRWMLLCRAEELCQVVAKLWEQGDAEQAADGWLLTIREVLGELLAGIKDQDNPLAPRVADFYVFLVKLLTEVEAERDANQLNTLAQLLAIEKDTWHELLQRSEKATRSEQTGDRHWQVQTQYANRSASMGSIDGEPGDGSLSVEA